jgi:Tfp pilus assembly protein PilF
VQAARELMRQSLFALADIRLREAIKLAPDHLGAQLARADLLLRQNRLPEADAAYTAILAAHPDSSDAALGVAAIQIKRAPPGDQLAAVEASLNILIAKNPSLPRAHQLLGSVYEQRGDAARATAEYKKAAELALDR